MIPIYLTEELFKLLLEIGKEVYDKPEGSDTWEVSTQGLEACVALTGDPQKGQDLATRLADAYNGYVETAPPAGEIHAVP